MFGLKRGRSIAWHNNTACHAAGSLTSAVQPYIEQYANLAQDLGRVVVDLYEATHDMPKPGYFQMLGGPASGPEALVATIQHWGWKRIVVYFQNDPDAVKIADTFASLALPKGIEFELQLRESPGKDKGDVLQLLAARSNIYIFFGGVRSLIMRLHFVVACSAAQLSLAWLGLACAGHGCFNEKSTAIIRNRTEVAVICCCSSFFVWVCRAAAYSTVLKVSPIRNR